VPAQLSTGAVVPGLVDVRVWGDSHFSEALLKAELPRLKAKYLTREGAQSKGGAAPLGGAAPVSNLLALSGGADDGAFGAGLLVGWSEQGSRPEFDLVTGISAGALIAPFAFLGRDHDRELAGLFTSYSADQIYQANILSGLFGGNALADSAPLARLIEHYVEKTTRFASFHHRVGEREDFLVVQRTRRTRGNKG
jgi:predicted acylesterase/phospholipase RssA